MTEEAPVKVGNHFMWELSQVGYKFGSVSEKDKSHKKKKLHVCVNIVGIEVEDADRFIFRMRLYALWHGHERTDIEDSINLTLAEQEAFSIPHIHIANASEVEALDEPSLRIFNHKKAVIWNQLFRVTLRSRFDLENFPFDAQTVKISLNLNSPDEWDLYDLKCSQIQLNERVLDLSEWFLLEPSVKSVSDHAFECLIHLRRNSRSYMLNIVFVYVVLSALNLFAFTIDGFNDRLNYLITVVLTLVAFNFSVNIPVTGYVKLLDWLMLSHMLFSFAVILVVTAEQVFEMGLSNQALFGLSASGFCFITIAWGVWCRLKVRWMNKEAIRPLIKPRGPGFEWIGFQFSDGENVLKQKAE